jgi:hypothetical protein
MVFPADSRISSRVLSQDSQDQARINAKIRFELAALGDEYRALPQFL